MENPHTQFCGIQLYFHTLLQGTEKHKCGNSVTLREKNFLAPLLYVVKCSRLCCVLGVKHKTTLEQIFYWSGD